MIALVKKTLHERWIIGDLKQDLEVAIKPLADSIAFSTLHRYDPDGPVVDAEIYLTSLYVPRFYYALWAPAVSDECFVHPWLLANRERLVDPRLFNYIESAVRSTSIASDQAFGLLTMWQYIIEGRPVNEVGSYTKVPSSFWGLDDAQKKFFLREETARLQDQYMSTVMPEFPGLDEIRDFILTTRKEAGGRYACLG